MEWAAAYLQAVCKCCSCIGAQRVNPGAEVSITVPILQIGNWCFVTHQSETTIECQSLGFNLALIPTPWSSCYREMTPRFSPEAVCGGRPFQMGFCQWQRQCARLLHGTTVSHYTSEGMGLRTLSLGEGSHRYLETDSPQGPVGPAGDRAPGFPDSSSLTNDSVGILHVWVSTCILVGGEVSEGRGGRRLSFSIEKGIPKPENRGRTTECNAQYFMSAFRNHFLLKEAFWPMNASFLAHSKTNLFYLLPGLFP